MTRPLTIRLIALSTLSLALFAGCSSEKTAEKTADETSEKAAAQTAEKAPAETTAKAAEKAAPAKKAVQVKKPTPGERKAKRAIKWPEDGVQWVDDWAAARAKSAETGKPICLVVYADWCPRCKELAPMFAEDDLVEASEGLIMVRQDNDARPDWLQAYAEQGSYVPRIFFFGADGNLRTDVTSGHPRYPFFYSSRQKKALIKSMKTVSGT